MGWSEYTGSVGYVIPIWIVTGILILTMDRTVYQKANMAKEKKIAVFLGWLNVSLGVTIYFIKLLLP